MKTFTLTLAWGESDEGLYHWAGQAETLEAATRKARQEMDKAEDQQPHHDDCPLPDSGHVCKCPSDFDHGDFDPEEYELVDSVEGVNEYAATDMLTALKVAEAWMVAELNGRLEVEALATVRAAIAKGEGRA